MPRLTLAAALTGLAVLAAPPTKAEDVGFLRDILGPEREPHCWRRVYESGHLAHHPRQRVTEIRIDSIPRPHRVQGKLADAPAPVLKFSLD